MTIEIQNALLIKVNDIDSTYELVQANNDEPVHAGTLDDPLDASDAILLCSKLDPITKEQSQIKYYIIGVVIDDPTAEYCNFSFSDGTKTILSYGLSQDEAFTVRYGSNREISDLPIKKGDIVLIYGYLQNYSGKLEMVKAMLVSVNE